jgi:hypothetical protein
MEDLTKGIVSDENEDKEQESKESLMIESNGFGKCALFKDYSKENYETSKLKRLVR